MGRRAWLKMLGLAIAALGVRAYGEKPPSAPQYTTIGPFPNLWSLSLTGKHMEGARTVFVTRSGHRLAPPVMVLHIGPRGNMVWKAEPSGPIVGPIWIHHPVDVEVIPGMVLGTAHA